MAFGRCIVCGQPTNERCLTCGRPIHRIRRYQPTICLKTHRLARHPPEAS